MAANFSVWPPTAAEVDLLLFDDVDDARPSWIVQLDRVRNRTSYFWHVLVPGVGPGQIYVWRVDGTFDPGAGLRHDPSALLLDPYGVAVAADLDTWLQDFASRAHAREQAGVVAIDVFQVSSRRRSAVYRRTSPLRHSRRRPQLPKIHA